MPTAYKGLYTTIVPSKQDGIGGEKAFINSDDNKALMVHDQRLIHPHLFKMGLDKDRAAYNI